MNKKRILVAEGEEDVLALYKAKLEAAGFEVLPASSDVDVLRRVKEELPDLVILDIRLPGSRGLSTLEQILAAEEAPPVILTSRCQVADEGFLTWLAEECVPKSRNITELKRAIERVLARRAGRTGLKKSQLLTLATSS